MLGDWRLIMKLYALYKDGEIYKASFDQNTPFYETEDGARRAIQYATSKRCLGHLLTGMTEQAKQAFINDQRKRYEIRRFTLTEEAVIYRGIY